MLENYKLVCERRVRDFDPQHPLPVLPQHVGSNKQKGGVDQTIEMK